MAEQHDLVYPRRRGHPDNRAWLGSSGLSPRPRLLGRYDEAARLLQQALVVDPKHSPAMFALGALPCFAATTPRRKIIFFRPLHPAALYIWLQLASIEMHRNQVDKAEAAVRQALAATRGAGAHAVLGIILLVEGDRAAAASEFQQELRLDPQSEIAREGLARATGNVTGSAPR